MGCDKVPQRGDDGWILEDVWIDKKEGYEDWEPHVQAMKYEDGELALRFCYWKRNPDGRRGGFVNRVMWVYESTMEDLREEAKEHNADIILLLFRKLGE